MPSKEDEKTNKEYAERNMQELQQFFEKYIDENIKTLIQQYSDFKEEELKKFILRQTDSNTSLTNEKIMKHFSAYLISKEIHEENRKIISHTIYANIEASTKKSQQQEIEKEVFDSFPNSIDETLEENKKRAKIREEVISNFKKQIVNILSEKNEPISKEERFTILKAEIKAKKKEIEEENNIRERISEKFPQEEDSQIIIDGVFQSFKKALSEERKSLRDDDIQDSINKILTKEIEKTKKEKLEKIQDFFNRDNPLIDESILKIINDKIAPLNFLTSIKSFLLKEGFEDNVKLTDFQNIYYIVDFLRKNNVSLNDRADIQKRIRANILVESIFTNKFEKELSEALTNKGLGSTEIIETFKKNFKEEYIKNGRVNKKILTQILEKQLNATPETVSKILQVIEKNKITLPKINKVFIKGRTAEKRLGIQQKLSKLLKKLSKEMGFISIRGPSGDPMQRFGEPGDSKTTKEHTKSSYHSPGKGHLPKDPANSRLVEKDGKLKLAGQDPTDGPSGQLHKDITEAKIVVNITLDIAKEILGSNELAKEFMAHLKKNITKNNDSIINDFFTTNPLTKK